MAKIARTDHTTSKLVDWILELHHKDAAKLMAAYRIPIGVAVRVITRPDLRRRYVW